MRKPPAATEGFHETATRADDAENLSTCSPPAKLLEPQLDQIAPTLKRYPKRWAAWEGILNAERGKFDKVPRRTDRITAGVSTRSRWWDFNQAVAAYETRALVAEHGGGVGFNMTHVRDLVGIDLDDCVSGDGEIAPWAREIIKRARSYTERSPSGRGVRIFVKGTAPDDWTNHDRGIEVYAGHAPRYLTATGHRIPNTPADVQPAPEGFLDWLRATYRPARAESQPVEAGDMPDLLAEDALPGLDTLNLPEHALAFLRDGEDRGDGSRALAAATRSLYEVGLGDEVVLSLLWANDHARAVALRHRRDDEDRALEYIWEHHCTPQRAKAIPVADEFEVLPNDSMGTAARSKFKVEAATEYGAVRPAPDIVKGAVPKAATGVIYGASTAGKSFFAFDLFAAVARGVPWRGHKTRQERVVYVAAEGQGGFRNRLAAYDRQHGGCLKDAPLGVIGAAPNLLGDDDKALALAIQAWGGAGVVVIDTLARAAPGADENSSADMGRILAHCQRLHEATGALVVLIHHSGKDLTKGARGWSGLKAAADFEIEVSRNETERWARLTKSKDGEDGAVWGFRLLPVVLGEDDGEEISSCVVEHIDESVARGKQPRGRWQRAVYQAVHDLTTLGNDEALAVEAVVSEAVKGEVYDPGPNPKKPRRDVRRYSATRALGELVEAGILASEDGKVRLPR
jgi:hypothetical protein